jgi:hypothetical protein
MKFPCLPAGSEIDHWKFHKKAPAQAGAIPQSAIKNRKSLPAYGG